MSYSSLHNHSHFSLQDGFGTPKEMLDRAREIGLKGFAITEHGVAYSWPYFDKLKKEYPEIKMIYGVEFYECFDINIKDKDNKYFHLVALAKNEQGRKSLNELITRSEFEGKYYKPRVDLNMLKPHANNLIVLSACLASKIAREDNYGKCIEYVNEYKNIFSHFYLEMQSHQNQQIYNQKIFKLSQETNTPFVITTDSHVAVKEHLKYQARHVQIARDADTISESYEGCYIQSDDEIHEVMDKQIGKENVDIGLKNTDIISDLIEVVNMPFQSPQLPTFPLPEGFSSNNEYLKHLTQDVGWFNRGYDKRTSEEQKIRQKRLEYELEVIDEMGFCGYFLIVWDYINFCKENGYPVGPGRGSGGGSIVCYLLGISALDPIDYNLIFERFLNRERVSMPDIDLDFGYREKVIEYLMKKYGEMRVCQVLNLASITPVVAIKDVGRVLKDENGKPLIPSATINSIAKLFTEKEFDKCIELNGDLIRKYNSEVYKELFDIARMLSGRIRHVSTHAGGVGIVDTSINDYMPMKLGDKGEHVIQVDKIMIEEIGIIKFDILGLKNLIIIDGVKKRVGLSDYDLDPNNPKFLNDKKMYQLLQSGKTNNVFQVESQGMKDLLIRLQPTSLEDISAVLALYRPDSMSYLEDYIYYKHHQNEIKYIHEDMKSILKTTYGQCIAKGEVVSTPNGNIEIQNLKDGNLINTLDGVKNISKIWSNGFKNIYELTLCNGKKIKSTINHKYLTQRGWIELGNIKDTDVIAMNVGNNNTNTYSKNKLKIIGYLLGDGYLNGTNGVHFYNTNLDFVLEFKKCVEEAYDETIVNYKLNTVPSGSKVYDCIISSKNKFHAKTKFLKDLVDWELRSGNNGKTAKNKFVPQFIFNLNTDCLLTFLGACIDTDGCITSRGQVRYKTSSIQLAFDIQELIRLIGFNSTITQHKNESIDITVSNSHMFSKLLKGYSGKIGLFNFDLSKTTNKSLTNCIYIDDVSIYINKYIKENNLSGREFYKISSSSLPRQINSKSYKGRYISIDTLNKLNKFIDFPQYWLDDNISWCKIDSIKNTFNTMEVFDMEVENVHHFIVNGIVVHNCIYQEQLMDIVRQFGGRTYGGADKFRKGIGKKDLKLVQAESDKLYKEIKLNNYDEELAKLISDDLRTKGGLTKLNNLKK